MYKSTEEVNRLKFTWKVRVLQDCWLQNQYIKIIVLLYHLWLEVQWLHLNKNVFKKKITFAKQQK